jgi:hypothetical protein
VFETINEWQKAWARYHTGNSAIDYVRTSGSGPDALLLNAGQIDRRGRNWWRNILDQYGAADVVFPIARLERQWPGGPVIGRFAARYGPDNRLLGEVTLRAENDAAVPKMLDQAIEKLNAIYTQALIDGRLRPDPSLVIEEPLNASALDLGNMSDLPVETTDLAPAAGVTAFSIQFDTPDDRAVTAGEASVRAIPGVRSASTTSLALGGVSVMQVSFEGSVEMLRAGLQARGYSVNANGTTLRISRRTAGGGAAGAP